MEIERQKTENVSFDTALGRQPLMIDAKTYNTSHPDYNANLVRNFPGKIFNAEKRAATSSLPISSGSPRMTRFQTQHGGRSSIEALEEANTVPHSDQVFERRAYIENYIKELTEKYDAHYAPGWVNLDDALFLYWLVRKLNPKTIVQTGVCNGLSSAFMMLGLVKNGPTGRLHVIDLAPVFNSKDPRWTVKGRSMGSSFLRANRPAGWCRMHIGIDSKYGTAMPKHFYPNW